jgi:hypothetical protein
MQSRNENTGHRDLILSIATEKNLLLQKAVQSRNRRPQYRLRNQPFYLQGLHEAILISVTIKGEFYFPSYDLAELQTF